MLEKVIDNRLYFYHHCPDCNRDYEAIGEDEAEEIADAVREYIKTKYGLEVE